MPRKPKSASSDESTKTVPESAAAVQEAPAAYQPGDHVKYQALHRASGPQSTGVIMEVHTSGGRATTEHPTYLIKNDNTQKATMYGARNIVEKL